VPRRRVLIILNPAAGGSGIARRRLGRVIAGLEQRGCAVVLRRAAAAGDAERLARDAEPEFAVIVAAGGDGTLNAVVNGLAGTKRPVALLPMGTANVMARDIGLPRRADRLAELIASGPVRPVWPGRVDNRLFLAMAGSGFDAEIVAAVDSRLKHRFGRLAFAWAILLGLLRHRPQQLRVRVDGIEHRAAAVIAAKGRYYAGGYVIAPQADPAEPILDLVLFQRAGRVAVVRYLAALLLGRLPRRKDIVFLRTRTACVSAAEPVPVEADGEPVGILPAEFGIGERPLHLIRP
jgi:diacylglycerol kinase (ATP)